MEAKQISKQMELFEEGGLKDEGGMIDEVSGNDVPTGSTREEVRDDIPAQLSEGEFVLPADVVRYHGLEKIMALRDEAKQGLAKMEAMGQMGNSEEATLPDDIPFDIDDLDMEDEDESQQMAEGGYILVGGKPMPVPRIGGQPLNMQVGGVVTPTATGTYQIPTNISQQPSYFANYQQSVAPFQPFVPPAQQTPVQQPIIGQQPTFKELMPQLTGQRETIEYRNAAGQKLFIPFINGKPIYPIPEGYTRYVAEEQPIADDKPVTSTTTQVTTGDGSDDVLSQTSQVRGLDNSIVSTDFANQTPDKVAQNMANMSLADRGLAVANAIEQSKGYTGLAKGVQQLGAAVVPGVLAGKMYGQKTMNPMDVLGKIGQPDMAAKDAITGAFGYDVKGFMDLSGLIDDPLAEERAEKNAIAQAMGFKDLSAMTSYYGIEPTHVKGYNPGQTDPTHGGVYSINGQTTDANGNVSYSSMADFGRAMNASSKSGYYGTEEQAKEDAKNGNPKAKDFLNRLNAKRVMDKQNEKDKEASTRGGRGSLGVSTDQFGGKSLGDGYGIGDNTGPGSQTMGTEDVDPTGGGTSTGPGATAGGSTEAPGTGTGPGDPNDGEGADSGPGGAGESSEHGGTYKGSLITKRKASGKLKKKYMKRGGLASR